jgi:proteasome beta subunit
VTLILAIPATDGVVFASDSQVTFGPVRSTTAKIQQLNPCTLWAGSGEIALIQRFGELLGTLPNRNQPLATIRDGLGHLVKNAVSAMLAVDFRTQFFSTNPDQLLGLHPGDFLFVECNQQPKILHLMANGTSEWITHGCTATGNGAMFAYALLTKYAGHALTRERAKLLAYKVIDEAIQVGSYGVGPPIDVWEVSATGCNRASDEEREALKDAAEAVRDQEVLLLAGAPAPPPAPAPAAPTPAPAPPPAAPP